MSDDLALIRTMWTEAINPTIPRLRFIQTGNQIPGRPTLGAWISYGLGSLNQSLPEFIVLNCRSARSGALFATVGQRIPAVPPCGVSPFARKATRSFTFRIRVGLTAALAESCWTGCKP